MMSLLEQYDEFERLSESSISKKKELQEAVRYAFEKVAQMHPDLAKAWIEKMMPIRWDNYLSKVEADHKISELVNQDGSLGGKWTRSQIEAFLSNNDLHEEEEPYFNFEALYATMNMIASDHYDSLASMVPENDMAMLIYKMAIEKLKDADKREFIREYFGL